MGIKHLEIEDDYKDMDLSIQYFQDPIINRLKIHLPSLIGSMRLCRVLKADKILSNLKPFPLEPSRSILRDPRTKDTRQTMLGLVNVDYVSRLKIDLVEKDPRLELIMKKLKDFKSLSSLTLHIRGRIIISGLSRETILLLRDLRYLSSLSHLNLGIYNIPIKLKTLLPNSHHLPFLSSLSLLGVFTANKVKSLVPYFRSLKSLRSLDIKLTSCHCSEKDILSLFDCLNTLKGLLNVTIHVYPELEYRLRVSTNLSEFTIDDYHRTERNLSDSANLYLINLSCPSALNLTFSSSRVCTLELFGLYQPRQYFKSLLTASLKLSYCCVSSLAVQRLSATIKRFEWLNTLVLDISSCGQTIYRHIGAVFDALAVLKKLSALALSCDFSEPMDKKAMESLGSSLKHLDKLTTLKLSFLKAQQMTDAKALSVLSGLGRLSCLTSLSLNFTFCEQLSNNVIYSIALGLKSLRSLHKVELEFCDCDKITDRGLNALSASLQGLKDLSHLLLDFKSYKNISDETIDTLFGRLRYLARLVWINLRLGSRYSEKGKQMERDVVALKQRYGLAAAMIFNDLELW